MLLSKIGDYYVKGIVCVHVNIAGKSCHLWKSTELGKKGILSI